ncbi:unnamed protein product [Musa textilis]
MHRSVFKVSGEIFEHNSLTSQENNRGHKEKETNITL